MSQPSSDLTAPGLDGLPDALRRAQLAMHLPEVQQMLKRLAEHNLGIYMPHMHDDATGAFQPLPEAMTQVEDGLRVSFQRIEDCEREVSSAVEVGWVWRNDRAVPGMACTARCVNQGSMHTSGHNSSG